MVDEQRKVDFLLDTSKARRELAELRKAQESLAQSALKGDKAFEDAAKEIGKLQKQENSLLKTVRQLDPEFDKATRSVKEQTDAIKEQSDSLGDLAAARRKAAQEEFDTVSQNVSLAGDFQSNLGAASGLSSAAGLGGLGQSLSLGGEAVALFEELPRLKASFAGLPDTIRSAADSLGTTPAALGGLAVSTIALSAAMAIGQAQAKKSRDELTSLYDTMDKGREVQFEATKLTDEELDARLKEVQSRKALAEETDNTNKAIVRQLENTPGWIRVIGETSAAIGVGNQAFAVAREEAQASGAELAKLAEEERVLLGIRENGENSAANAALAEEELSVAREKAAAALDQQIAQTQRNAEQALNRSDQLGKQIQDQLDQRAQSQANAAEKAALEAKFYQEDQLKAEQNYRNQLASIAEDGQKRITKLESGFGGIDKDRSKDLADVDSKGNEKLAKLNAEYFKSRIDATQDFNRETEKLQSDSAKRIKQIGKDLANDLADASRENDVLKFLEAQRSAERAIQEEKEGATDTEKERLAEFQLRMQEERAAFNEKQAEIQAAIQEERNRVIESYAKKRAALEKQIAAEKAALAEQLAQAEANRQEQLKREAEQAERQAERQALQEKQEKEAFNKRIAELREQRNAEQQKHAQELSNVQQLQSLKQQTYSSELSALQQIEAAALRLKQTASTIGTGGGSSRSTFGSSRSSGFRGTSASGGSAGSYYSSLGASSSSSTSSSSSRFGYKSSNFKPFHNGGMIDFKGARKEGLIFAKEGEGVISEKDIGFPAGGTDKGLPLFMQRDSQANSKQPVTVIFSPQISAQVGDIATKSQVTQALNEVSQTTMGSLLEVIEKAVS